MIKAAGFNYGRLGDLCMASVAARHFKLWNPDVDFTFCIGEEFKEIEPLFYNLDYINQTHIWEDTKNGFNNPNDIEYSKQFKYFFPPFPRHPINDWYNHIHQVEETILMNGIKPFNKDFQIRLNKYWEDRKFNKTVAFCPFGATRGTEKSLSIEKGIEIIELLKKLGYSVIQLGGAEDFRFDLYNYENNYTCYSYNGKLSFFESVKYALNCDFLLTVDTGMVWAASGYQHPTLGLYNASYYAGASNADNWCPHNKNLIKLEDPKNLNDIDLSLIEESIKQLIA